MGVKNLTFVDQSAPPSDAEYLNSVRAEINNLITNTGQSVTTATLNQLETAVSIHAAGGDFYTDSGVADAYVLSTVGSKLAPDDYFNGMKVRFLPGNANTGASTINVATLGSINIKLADGSTDPAAGDILADSEIQLTYDGTVFRISSRAEEPQTSVITTRGDIITGDSSGDEQRLALGTVNQILLSDGTDAIWSDPIALLESVYPVGSVYMNKTVATNPATLLGFGTWVAITDKFLVSRGSTFTATGGAETQSLSSTHNGPHTHTFPTGTTISTPATNTVENATDATANGTITTTSSGSGTAFSIIPPYQAIYTWERTV